MSLSPAVAVNNALHCIAITFHMDIKPCSRLVEWMLAMHSLDGHCALKTCNLQVNVLVGVHSMTSL